MPFLSLFLSSWIFCPAVVLSEHRTKSDIITMKYTGTQAEAIAFAGSLGLQFKRKVLENYDWYEFTKPDLKRTLDLDEIPDYNFDLKELRFIDRKLKAINQEEYYKRVKKSITINDQRWIKQWHIKPEQTPSMNVYKAWEKGYTGQGVGIAIVDDGIDTEHIDLSANYDPEHSYDFINDELDSSHKYFGESHGTNCAGVAAAVKNSFCVVGIAFEASLSAIRLLDPHKLTTASDEARALTHALSHIDIYSNSWGPTDDGTVLSELSLIHIDALKKGVTEGRNGLGAIYTWASGNGGEYWDDCNADGYASSPYTIAIATVTKEGFSANYSEVCSAILAAAYGGDNPNYITTTSPSDTCVDTFSGTSSATPVASGIIALTLQANPNLTWRDVQHIIVENSISTGLNDIFHLNGAGKKVSDMVGFGLMDAEAMVDNAPNWLHVPSHISCDTMEMIVSRSSDGKMISETYTYGSCHISYLENVIITVDYYSSYRGDVRFHLISPSGTHSVIFSERINDDTAGRITWDFLSVHFWGENPTGTWELDMSGAGLYDDTTMHLYSWKISFTGTVTDPLAGQPVAGTLGSTCIDLTSCNSIVNGGCLRDGKICVVCTENYRNVESFCERDGDSFGYCDETILCTNVEDECINNFCRVNPDEDGVNYAPIIIGCSVAVVLVIMVVGGVIVFKTYVRVSVGPLPATQNYSSQQHDGTQSISR